jgi:release factor glutamine methyltransferase
MSPESQQKTWRMLDLINWSVDYLNEKGVENSRTAVEWMLTHVLKLSRVDLYLNFDRPLSREELSAYKPLLLKCAAHQPVQQVIGSTEFYGLQLKVNEHVLIPRPETEQMVDYIIHLADKSRENLSILDIGSGSGAIAISLALLLPNASVTALEVSPEAADVLKHNLRFHNLANRVSVIREDVFSWNCEKQYDIIVSNPPYISLEEMESLPPNVGYYEPPMALTDREDGLRFYRFFSQRFQHWLAPGGMAVLEFGGPGQTDSIKELFKDFDHVVVRKDYQNDDRFISFFKPEP